jgi:hypothetical protein
MHSAPNTEFLVNFFIALPLAEVVVVPQQIIQARTRH